MKNRSPIGLFFLATFIPFYAIYWLVTSGREMRALGADVPTAWLLLIPFVSIWWLYKYGAAVEHVTNGKTSAILAFLVMWLLGSVGYAIVQDAFNKVSGAPMGGMAVPMPAGPQPLSPGGYSVPQPSFTPPAPASPVASVTPEVPAVESTAPQPPAAPTSI